METQYRICSRCIMDTSEPDIEFDQNGVCNHCHQHETLAAKYLVTGPAGERKLQAVVEKIKKQGSNQKYDSVIGLSGGLDSSYVAYLAWENGLRPLAVSLDNGWDSEIASNNVKNIVEKLGLDLLSYRVDFAEFRDLQLAYLKASVVNIEAITDHAIAATLYNVASKKGIRYILTGINLATEGVTARSWGSGGYDLANIKAIHKKFGAVELKTYPTLSIWRRLYLQYAKRITSVALLNYVPYVQSQVAELLGKELGWQDYGGKHCESIFTRFYQCYILPTKFGIDKRRAHLSNLIYSGQMTREQALQQIQKPPYTAEQLRADKQYVLARLGLSEGEFESLMGLPVRSHYEYASDEKVWQLLQWVRRAVSPLGTSR